MPFGRTAFWPATLFPAGPTLPAGISVGSPHAWATLPAGSNSITGGDALDLNCPPSVPVCVSAPPTPSGEVSAPFWKARVTMNTWSWESTQVPPTSPVTQLSGSGLGQNGSTWKVGARSGGAFIGAAAGSHSAAISTAPAATDKPVVPT